ncbi:MAG: extracellular solute-binding protein [Lentisphaeria bacterium]|nr:extracellular solute-binding protein [Lentisphaeria bacterium]
MVKKHGKTVATTAALLALALLICLWGCGDGRRDGLTLILISPHNENIQREFGDAFSAWHETNFGAPVRLEWRDVGGGTSAIVQYLRNVYARSDSAGIDILWGGGEQVFTALASEGVFTPISFIAGQDDILSQIPETFGGMRLRDENLLWCGSALSGFGFLYNKTVLDLRQLPYPAVWRDLGHDQMFGLLALADPTQSGSAAAAYEMIVQSEGSWPTGWKRLMLVLGNAGRFYDSAGDAANAPVAGEAAVATCIDFYGAVRVRKSPDALVYISPAGETAYSPDPIAMLKNPPSLDLAKRFTGFVLSKQGQALWAVRPGEPGGPVREPLGRQPIRRDVYDIHAGKMSPWISNPYQTGKQMTLDVAMKQSRAEALKVLIRCAAVDNLPELKKARKKIMGLPAGHPAVKAFGQLPPEVADAETLRLLAEQLKDPGEAEKIISRWQTFFRNQYKTVNEQ